MGSLYARKALLPGGWATGVRLRVSNGRIEVVEEEASPKEGEAQAGIVIPGLCNAHSHAFQRALVGRTEQRSPEGQDNFWTWRKEMYRLATAIDADAMKAIATQVYTEMLVAGYTSVAEFHYLHHAGFEAIIAAVIGGCLLTGGYGSAIGASFGALIFGTVQMGIFYTGVNTDWFKVFLGVMMLIAVLFNSYIRRKVTEAR